MTRIPKSSFQHQSYAVMLLIHEMSSRSQSILNVVLNANADPLVRTGDFSTLHLAPAQSAISFSPSPKFQLAEAIPPSECKHWLRFLQPVVSQGRMESRSSSCTGACARTHTGEVPTWTGQREMPRIADP